MDKDWLTRKLTVEEAEAENLVSDERLGLTPVPFGYCNSEWRNLRAQIQPGDELWEFTSPAESWAQLFGRAGIALIREGEVVDSITTMMN